MCTSLGQHTFIFFSLILLPLSWTTMMVSLSYIPGSLTAHNQLAIICVLVENLERIWFYQPQIEQSGDLHVVPRTLAGTMGGAILKSFWGRKVTKSRLDPIYQHTRWFYLKWNRKSNIFICGRWDLPGSGIEPVSPALADGLFTAEPPGKPH